jgi:PBSX family phage terminase large subunit
MKLFKKQRSSVRNSKARLNIWEGSVRSGKTVASLIRFLRFLGRAPKGEVFLIGKTLDTLKRNVINPLLDYVGNAAHHYPGKREFHIWDRVCWTVGANDERSEGKIRGSTTIGAYGDELTLWPESFFKMMLSRMSLEGAQFFGSTNPDNPNHYLKKDFLDRKAELDMWTDHFAIEDNTFLPKAYVEQLKKEYVGLWYKRFILGLWCAAEGAIYDFFDEDEHTIISRPGPPEMWHIGIDYGTNNPAAFLIVGEHSLLHPRYWAEDEYYYSGAEAQKQKTDSEYSEDFGKFISKYTSDFDSALEGLFGIEMLMDLKQERVIDKPVGNIFIDPSASSFRVQLTRDGFWGIRKANNSVLDGIRTVSRLLKNGDYAIHVRCKNNIKEKYGYMWDKRAQLRGEDKPTKVDDHLQDTERYILESLEGENRTDYAALSDIKGVLGYVGRN